MENNLSMEQYDALVRDAMEWRQYKGTFDNYRSALQAFSAAFENRGETTSLKVWNDRMKEANANAKEVLCGREPFASPKAA